MNTIKFRAFDDGAIIYSHNNSIVHEYGALGWFFGRIREDAIVMQFTGLTDKNGKEIYEGDLLVCWSEVNEIRLDENEPDYISLNVVKFTQGEWVCDTVEDGKTYLNEFSLFNTLKYSDCEIYGNIYENPELSCN